MEGTLRHKYYQVMNSRSWEEWLDRVEMGVTIRTQNLFGQHRPRGVVSIRRKGKVMLRKEFGQRRRSYGGGLDKVEEGSKSMRLKNIWAP